jgi:GTP-binding protein EngB required for normal cell division
MYEDTPAERLQTLADHRRLLGVLSQRLREVQAGARQLGIAEMDQRVGQVLKRVESETFKVAIVGEFKRGKSTLINALLGREVLPADVLPCSATLNRVTYGLTPEVLLRFKADATGKRREQTIGIDDLADYVTQLTPGSGRRAADIEEAVVRYPTRFCRDKADIIDTPGLNDSSAMTDVTLEVLPKVDAAVLVILAQSPFSRYEADFLKKMMSHDLGRVIYVVNRMDEIRRKRDKQRVLDVVRTRIQQTLEERAAELHGEGTEEAAAMMARIGTPKIYAISGGLALDGKLEDDAELFEESRFGEFEEGLERFLTLERGAATLEVMADTSATGARQVLQQISIRRAALHIAGEEFSALYAETSTKLDRLEVQLTGETKRLDDAARDLRRTLRPRAAQFNSKLVVAVNEVIDQFPLTAKSLKRGGELAQEVVAAVSERAQAVARLESERVQLEIEAALTTEIDRLSHLGQSVAQELAQIDLNFQEAGGFKQMMQEDAIDIGTGAVVGAIGGVLTGGFLGGAVSGYREAGLKGAATGAAAGLVGSVGTAVAGVVAIQALGLALTWPVVLPTLAVAGVVSALSGKWTARLMFSQERAERYREDLRLKVLTQLDEGAGQRVEDFARVVDEQVNTAYATLRAKVQSNFGGPVDATRQTLDELHARSSRTAAQRDHELESLERLTGEMQAALSITRDVAAAVRATQ